MEKPAAGVWKSGQGFPPVTVTVVRQFADADGYFLARVSVEGDPLDLELDPDEWRNFVAANGLTPS
ncbi:MAG: hypothetical protein ACM3X0_16410 [Bacteroidota bacterium]